jgi:serralysin
VTGQFSGWALIGGEQTAGGYEVAWKNAGTGQFTVWNTDSSGNYLSNAVGLVTGTDTTLQSLETSFHQDLNGDGVTGLNIPTTIIESFGSTSLTQVGNDYFLFANGTSSGPELKLNGAPVVTGQFSGWALIGGEQTAGGYEVAWKNAGTGQYTVWNTDSNGNYLSNAVGLVTGTDTALKSLEPSFHQDLNGDGVTGLSALGAVGLDTVHAKDLLLI